MTMFSPYVQIKYQFLAYLTSEHVEFPGSFASLGLSLSGLLFTHQEIVHGL